jgi:hypothetical protein
MWDEIVRRLPGFPSAVITGIDMKGYPFSARCHPIPSAADQVLRVQIPPDALLQTGPASLLCHKHDQLLWWQESFLVRGALLRDDQGWIFQPQQLIPGIASMPCACCAF